MRSFDGVQRLRPRQTYWVFFLPRQETDGRELGLRGKKKSLGTSRVGSVWGWGEVGRSPASSSQGTLELVRGSGWLGEQED